MRTTIKRQIAANGSGNGKKESAHHKIQNTRPRMIMTIKI
jgi:hypothetical protein